MPSFQQPRFRPLSRVAPLAAPAEPAAPAEATSPETMPPPAATAGADPGFDDGEELVGRVEPKPRFRALSAEGGGGSGSATPSIGGTVGSRNPFMERLSIDKSDVNPYRVKGMLGYK